MGSIDTSTLLATESPTIAINKVSKQIAKSSGINGANLPNNADEKVMDETDESDTDAEPEQDGTVKKLQPSQRKRQQHAVFDAW